MVQESGDQYHILLIIGDGEVSHDLDCLGDSRRAIVEASSHPLSIVMVGVGDGPFDLMHELDDGLAERRFDNFQFVPLAPFQALLAHGRRSVVECAFAVAALQEIPEQYTAIRDLGLLGHGTAAPAATGKRAADAREGSEESPAKSRRT